MAINRKAFFVGINDYAPAGAGGPDLRGCVNDVALVATTLKNLGVIPASNMRFATDQRATRAAIISGFKWLLTGAKKGDVLVFHYSGHGSQVADTGGDELESAPKRDETICPHDFASAGMIKDDDFRLLLANLPAGVNLDIFLDSCFSGTGTRELAALGALEDSATLSYRYVEAPIDWSFGLEGGSSLPTQRVLSPYQASEEGAREVQLVSTMNHVLWAGCRDYQTSAETMIGGKYHGVMSYYLCKALTTWGTNQTRRQLDARISSFLRSAGFGQVPQLEGTKESVLQKVFT